MPVIDDWFIIRVRGLSNTGAIVLRNCVDIPSCPKDDLERNNETIILLALRLELISSLPDCRGLFAVTRVHVVMPGRRARAPTSYLYCCVSIV